MQYSSTTNIWANEGDTVSLRGAADTNGEIIQVSRKGDTALVIWSNPTGRGHGGPSACWHAVMDLTPLKTLDSEVAK